MAAAYVKVVATQEDQDNAAAGWVLTIDSAPSAGNRLVLIASNEDARPTAVADNAGNTWVKLADPSTTGGAHNSTVWTAHLASVPTTITVTKAAAGDRPTVAGCIEISGVDAANDTSCLATAVVNNSGTGTSCSTGTSGTPSQDDCIAVGFWDNNDGKTFSAQTNSFTEAVDVGATGGGAGTPHVSLAYKVLTAAATQECTATRTSGAGVNWSAGMIVFKGAGGASAVVSERDVSYDVQNTVVSDRDVSYDVQGAVVSERDVSYDVQGSVVSARDVEYDIGGNVVSERGVVYDIQGNVVSDREVLYDVQAAVVSEREVVYDVINLIVSYRDVSYDVINAVIAAREVEYNVGDVIEVENGLLLRRVR